MPTRASRALRALLANPFAAGAAELAAGQAELAHLTREEFERLSAQTSPGSVVLAVAHARARRGLSAAETFPENLLSVRDERRLGVDRGACVRIARASARCSQQLETLVGVSPALAHVRQTVWSACFGRSLEHGLALERVIRHHDVLISGETGTGKEHVARALALGLPGDERDNPAPFAEINVAAVPDTLIESELFGHQKGAFTGATQARKGLVRSADRGSLFLDEVGDLPLATQVKLLRVIETDSVQPLGSDQLHRVDVRFIAATHHDLDASVENGLFRRDLFQRLAGVVIRLPALRERPEDIEPIGEHILREALEGVQLDAGRAAAERWLRSPEARAHTWPGNVRELRNALRNLLLGLPAGIVTLKAVSARSEALPSRIREGAASLAEVEAWYLQRALASAGGNVAGAARLLGIDRTTVARKLARS